MEKISWTDHVRNEDVLLRVKEHRNILHEIRKRKANWIGHILYRNCLLQRVIEGKIQRGIEVTGITYKVFSNVLNERLKKITKNLLGKYQCGFRENGSTSDQIFIIRQMMEKHYEHNQDLNMLFVDFKQAIDNIDRYKLYQVMEDIKIPYKLIRLVKMTMKNTTARVKITNIFSNSFTFSAGVRQGDVLSTTLLIITLHYGVQKIDQRGTIFTKLSQICA
jgi:hypothetical protein